MEALKGRNQERRFPRYGAPSGLGTQLPADVLAEIVSQIQQLLWLDADASGDCWNGDKEWDCETLESVAAVLAEHGLRPEGEEVGAIALASALAILMHIAENIKHRRNS